MKVQIILSIDNFFLEKYIKINKKKCLLINLIFVSFIRSIVLFGHCCCDNYHMYSVYTHYDNYFHNYILMCFQIRCYHHYNNYCKVGHDSMSDRVIFV